jgi:hypothetical protein
MMVFSELMRSYLNLIRFDTNERRTSTVNTE